MNADGGAQREEAAGGDYTEHRPLLFSIAYGMTGSVSDAEDIAQEAFARLAQALRRGTPVSKPKAYLATTATRLALNHLRSARLQRESYLGTWLPEPVLTGPGPEEHAEMADSLSMAFLVVLESLSAAERTVFLLHEVFGYQHTEIAEMTDSVRSGIARFAGLDPRKIGGSGWPGPTALWPRRAWMPGGVGIV